MGDVTFKVGMEHGPILPAYYKKLNESDSDYNMVKLLCL